MLFPYYLTFEGKELIELIAKAHYQVQENISWCSDGKYAGAVIHENKTFFICTKNILKGVNANQYLNETVYHEAVHVVQSCRGMKPIGIPLNKMPLSSNKIEDINKSIDAFKKHLPIEPLLNSLLIIFNSIYNALFVIDNVDIFLGNINKLDEQYSDDFVYFSFIRGDFGIKLSKEQIEKYNLSFFHQDSDKSY